MSEEKNKKVPGTGVSNEQILKKIEEQNSILKQILEEIKNISKK